LTSKPHQILIFDSDASQSLDESLQYPPVATCFSNIHHQPATGWTWSHVPISEQPRIPVVGQLEVAHSQFCIRGCAQKPSSEDVPTPSNAFVAPNMLGGATHHLKVLNGDPNNQIG